LCKPFLLLLLLLLLQKLEIDGEGEMGGGREITRSLKIHVLD